MKKTRKRNLILIGALAALALLLLGITPAGRGAEGRSFTVLLGGEEIGRYPLDQNAEIPIEDLCVIAVEDGAVFVRSSVCPQGICARHAPIRSAGETIVCLPNRLVIRIDGEAATDFVI